MLKNKINTYITIFKLFAISAFPFISFLSRNIGQEPSLVTLLVGFIILLSFVTVGYLLLKRWLRASTTNVIFVLVLLFFQYHAFRGLELDRAYRILLYLAVVMAVSALTVFLSKKEIFSKCITIVLVAMFAIPFLQLGYFFAFQQGNGSHFVKSKLRLDGKLNFKPNIYYIITDAYPRNDALRKFYQYDNSAIIDEIEKEGFVVAKNSNANYPLTYLSLASSLNMDYVANERTTFVRHQLYYGLLQGDNNLIRFLKARGYEYHHFYNGLWEGSKCGARADICSSKEAFLNQTAYTVLYQIPLSRIPLRLFGRSGHSAAIPELIKFIGESRKKSTGPVFLFAHTLPPHAPPHYDANCHKLKSTSGSLMDWEKKTFINQVKCVNKDLLRMIEKIKVMDKNPIIVIQSDHGSASRNQFEKKLSEWDKYDLLERFSILNAYYLPHECKKNIYPSISPVNSFRVIVACLQGKKPVLLKDKYFFAAYEGSPDYGKVIRINKDGDYYK